jgi:hypothetical protein
VIGAAIVLALLGLYLLRSKTWESALLAAKADAEYWKGAWQRADRHADEMFYRALDYKERLRRATERISAGTGYEKCGTGCAVQSERCAFSQECASE